MKLTTNGANEVIRSGVASETTFRIKTTAKAFDILSSGLYTDPKLAIVRELSANAYDAHVAAGKTQIPFEIHLPNALEPFFSVKDHGTGLSDEGVMTLYSTYFESTKADSNDFIGALGLGSKSPFSYTRAFEVISRHNGKRRTYSVFINEDGIPSIARLGEIDTDEDNGLEVRITIKQGDFFALKDRVANCLRWFPVKPTVSGYPGFKFPDVPKEHLSGNGWKLFDSSFVADYSKMTAVQGNIAYKVDIGQLNLNNHETRLFNRSHLVGEFAIGELEVAANREEIRYDERSKKALKAKITQMVEGVLASIEKQVDAIADKPFWDIVQELNVISTKIFNDRHLFKTFVASSTNKLLVEYRKIDGTFDIMNSLRGHEISGIEQMNNGRSTRKRGVGNAITPEPHITIFYNDLPKGGVTRIQEWVKSQKCDDARHHPTAIILRRKNDMADATFDTADSNKILTTRPWTEKDFTDELAAFIKKIGDKKILVVSTDTTQAPRIKSYYEAKLPMFNYGGVRGRYKKYVDWKRNETVDFQAGGLYFMLQNGSHIVLHDKDGKEQQVNWHMDTIESYLRQGIELINKHKNTSYTIQNLFGVGSQAIKKVQKNPAWVNFFDVLRSILKDYEAPVAHFKRMSATEDTHGIKSVIMKNSYGDFTKYVEALDHKSVFKQTVMPLIENHRRHNMHSHNIGLIKKLDVDFGTKMFDNVVLPYYTSAPFQTYPMFAFIEDISYQTVSQFNVLFDYIKLIDRS
jgi:hypothetical protein